jgi:hypothetical protein
MRSLISGGKIVGDHCFEKSALVLPEVASSTFNASKLNRGDKPQLCYS